MISNRAKTALSIERQCGWSICRWFFTSTIQHQNAHILPVQGALVPDPGVSMELPSARLVPDSARKVWLTANASQAPSRLRDNEAKRGLEECFRPYDFHNFAASLGEIYLYDSRLTLFSKCCRKFVRDFAQRLPILQKGRLLSSRANQTQFGVDGNPR